MISITNKQARCFILSKQGLIGDFKFIGKQGAFDFIRRVGCIQFDPVDLCGKNAEIVLQTRVKGFKKSLLFDLLYKDRLLFDYIDKQLSIIPVEFWPYFERYREAARDRLKEHPEIEEHIDAFLDFIKQNGAVNSDDFSLEGNTSWWSAINWSAGGKFSRSVLEQLYSSGDLIVHHKKGTRRYYDLAQRYISSDILNAPDPLPDEFEHLKWQVKRRIGAIGLLWNRPSDAWLGIWGLSNDIRNKIFSVLLNEKVITEVTVDGIKGSLFILSDDLPLMEKVISASGDSGSSGFKLGKSGSRSLNTKPRCEFLAPLDPFLWDRKLIKALFDFQYGWEIYTPPDKRKYGAYVLPVLFGDSFIGRIEVINKRDTKTLIVKNIWYEDGIKQTKKLTSAVDACIKRFARFNDCKAVG